jgi:multiple antibiotic resistance protein
MEFLETFLSTIGILLPVANPPNAAAVFYSLTRNQPRTALNVIAIKMAIYVAILLTIILLTGNWIMRLFNLPISIIQILGGSILVFVSWKLLKESNNAQSQDQQNKKISNSENQNITLFPLATPIIVGPGCIVSTLAIATRFQSRPLPQLLKTEIFVILGIAVVAILIAICCNYSGILINKLGNFWKNIFVKLAALTNLALGIHIIWRGIQHLI